MQSQIPQKVLDTVSRLKSFLSGYIVGREKEINDIILALLARENLLLVGPPGTGKTTMLYLLSRALGLNFFKRTAHQEMMREDFFGYVDLDTLIKQKRIQYIGENIRDAHIVFVDEIYRSSAAVRNMLLEILAKRSIDDVRIPCIAFYSASNFVSLEEEDQAFNDRFIKNFHGYIGDEYVAQLIEKSLEIFDLEFLDQLKVLLPNNYQQYASQISVSANPTFQTIANIEDVVYMIVVTRKLANTVKTKKFTDFIVEVRRKLLEKTIDVITDRSLSRLSLVTAAYTIVSGETLAPSRILRIIPMFSRTESEYKEILSVCSEMLKEFYKKEMEIVDAINKQASTILSKLNEIEQGIVSGTVDIQQASEISDKVIKFAEEAIAKINKIQKIEDLQLQTDQAKRSMKYLLQKAIQLQRMLTNHSSS